MQKILRQENEKIVKLKGMSPDNKLPFDFIFNKKLDSALEKFKAARKADIKNEKRPKNYKNQL